jgi:hypothetical protein
MELKVVAKDGLVSIETPDKQAAAGFSFALNKGMYGGTNHGVGCQVNTPAMAADIVTLGNQIANALFTFGEKYPELGILDRADTALANARLQALAMAQGN